MIIRNLDPFKAHPNQTGLPLGYEFKSEIKGLGQVKLVYCQANVDLEVGQPVEDLTAAEILSGATGTVTANRAAGIKLLDDTGEFTGDDYRGFYGMTLGDTIANGAGQSFWIREMIGGNDDTIRIECLYGYDTINNIPLRSADGGWVTALVSGLTTYQLWCPGLVTPCGNQPNFVRCVPLIPIDVSEAPYFYGVCKGNAPVRIDVSGDALVIKEWLTALGTGRAEGLTAAGTTADEILYALGSNPFGDFAFAGTDDPVMIVPLNIPSRGQSQRYALDTGYLN